MDSHNQGIRADTQLDLERIAAEIALALDLDEIDIGVATPAAEADDDHRSI